MENTTLHIEGNTPPECAGLLSAECLRFVGALASRFGGEVADVLAARADAAMRRDDGQLPDFLAESADIRNDDWVVAPPPPFLEDRRVEITAPAERKKAIIALNSEAKVYMADFEDSLTPTWENIMRGQLAMRDAASGDCILRDDKRDKTYQLNPYHQCVLIVRPRGWHLVEKHALLDGAPIAGGLFDFGVFFFHNAKTLLARGRAPCFYLPKTEHWREAALWDKIMAFAEQQLGIAPNTAKATLLIETLPAVFQMHEILHSMRGRLVGLNCGRWDYIFSYIKTLRGFGDRVLPERNAISMSQPFLAAYSRELVEVCHRRGAHAMGGMSAFIPIRGDADANAKAVQKVRDDKRLELQNGHDGTWVAHPDLISVAREVFDESMPQANQKHKRTNQTHDATQLLQVPKGDITAAGVDNNIHCALHYIAAWLGGSGAVPIFNLMEDAATAEIARTQLWQWRTYGAGISGGGLMTADLFEERLKLILPQVNAAIGEEVAIHTPAAAGLLRDLVMAKTPPDFLTLPASEMID